MKKDFKEKVKMSRKAIWGWVKETVKDPLTFILFGTIWILLASPAIFGIIAYMIDKKEKWLILSGSWVLFTAPPLPLPVTPLSIAGAVTLRQAIRKSLKKRNEKKKKEKEKESVPLLNEEKEGCESPLILEDFDLYKLPAELITDEELIVDDGKTILEIPLQEEEDKE